MRGLKLILLLAGILLEAGCGLPDQYYIQSPIPGTIAGGTGSQFNFFNPDHTKDLNITFKGYELYYQFYPDYTSININAYDPNNSADVNAQLLAAGFLPLVSGGQLAPVVTSPDSYPNRTDPVIPVSLGDIGTSFSVTITVVPTATPAVQYVFGGLTGLGNLRRDVQDTVFYTGQYKDFQANGVTTGNYVLGDVDCTKIPTIPDPVYLAMYAVSYGLVGISTPQRSVPIYLGYLTITINH
jgi:hypothetical protein